MERITTGISTLDQILDGGFPDGSAILISGRPGTGKTILAHQIIFHNASPDSRVIYFTTLSEPTVKVLKYQQQFTYFDQDKFQRSVIYRDLGSTLRKWDPAYALGVINETLQQHKPRLIVLDTVKTVAEMISSLIEYREFLLDLTMNAATWGCTTLLLGEYAEEDVDILPESAIVDGIVYLSGIEEKKQQKRFLRILKMRGTNYAGGENVFRITENGIELFPRLRPKVSEQDYKQYSERLSMGLPELDEMMDGGIPRGSTTLVSGSSGTGKTLLALHFAYAGLLAGEAVLYVTFEENPAQIIFGSLSLGMDFQPYLTSGKFRLLHVSPMELDVDEHVFDIQKLVEGFGVKRVVIDSISSFEIGMTDKNKYTDFLWAMTDYYKTQGVSLLLTHEIQDAIHGNEFTKHGISYLADNLLLLRYREQGSGVKRCLRVVKMRSSKHDNCFKEILIQDHRFLLREVTF